MEPHTLISQSSAKRYHGKGLKVDVSPAKLQVSIRRSSMADPLSLAASVVALIQAIQIGREQFAKLKACYHAPPEIARLRAQMESLGQLLAAVQTFARRHYSAHISRLGSDLLEAPMATATARVASVNQILNSDAFGLSRLSDENKARLTLLRYRRRLVNLEKEIRESIQDIGARLSLLTADAAEQIPQIRESLDICLQFQGAYSEKLPSTFDSVTVSEVEGLIIPEAPQLSTALKHQEPGMTQLKPGQRRQIRDTVQTKGPAPSERPIFKKQSDCRPGCHCSCHFKRDYNSPALVNSLLGELSIQWRSQKQEVRCNCSGQMSFAVVYRFPQFLLQRYMTFILQSTYLDGPELILRVPRVLPWTHLLWRYSVCGDLKAIKHMYANRQASPYDVDPAGRNALLYASKQQSAKVAQFLLDQGNDSNQIDNRGRPTSDFLLQRSFGGMYGEHGEAIMRRVLKDDDSFEEFGFKTLHQIILQLIPKKLEVVLEATTDAIDMPDSTGRTALFWAVIRDSADHVRLLLNYGADANAKDTQGYTPIDFVRGPTVCKLLLDHGAINNINAKNDYHSSLHEHVIQHGCPEVMALFAKHGFPIDIKDHDDETPLLNAIYAGHTAVVALLLDLGADANKANLSSRDSALHFAANFDRPHILKFLLDRNADHTALDCNGRNLAHCAARAGSTELVKTMSGANLVNLDLALKDHDGRTAGDYMSDRIVMTDVEVGVHEAWEELVEGLSLPPPGYMEAELEGEGKRGVPVVVEEEVLLLDKPHYAATSGYEKMPGAFPIETVREINVSAA